MYPGHHGYISIDLGIIKDFKTLKIYIRSQEFLPEKESVFPKETHRLLLNSHSSGNISLSVNSKCLNRLTFCSQMGDSIDCGTTYYTFIKPRDMVGRK